MSDNSLIDNFLQEMDKNAEDKKKFEEMLNNLSDEQVMELLKKNNPYSTTIPHPGGKNEERSVSFSFTNMRLDYMKELITTAMIGYLFQRVMIYGVPEQVRPISIDEYLKKGDAACVPPPFITDEKLREKYVQMHETMKERVIIYKFLKDVFQYNPDRHVRSSWYPVKDDQTRELIGTEAGKLAVATKNTVRNIKEGQDHYPSLEDLNMNAKPEQIGNPVYEVIPPADHYETFNNYLEDNYDDFIKVVYNITGSRPDLDVAINVYQTHNTIKEAEAFRSDHMDEVIAGVMNTPMNKWSVLAPYAENKKKEDFFNRETVHLKGMLDSREEKEKLAKDMLKKRVHKKKVENIKENGPDSEKFKEWAKQNNSNQSSFGSEYKELDPSVDSAWSKSADDKVIDDIINSARQEERSRVLNLHPTTNENLKIFKEETLARVGEDTSGDHRRKLTLPENDECPDSAVEIGVFKIGNGGLDVFQDKIYTESEAPSMNKQ